MEKKNLKIYFECFKNKIIKLMIWFTYALGLTDGSLFEQKIQGTHSFLFSKIKPEVEATLKGR